MICAHCHANNPESNNFCGTCGYAFPFHETPVRPVVEEHHYTPISGPSLLGLDQSDDDSSSSYLLDDEEHHHRSHAGWYVFSLVAVAILACVGYLEWRAIKTGKVEFPSLSALTGSSPEQPKPQDQTAPKQTADLKPQSDNTPEAAPAEHPLAGDEEAAKQSASATPAGSASAAEAPKPATPKEDGAATQQAESKAAKKAAEERQTASKDDEEESNAPAKPSRGAKAKPSAAAKAAEPEQKPADPRTNRMLVAGEKYLYGRGVAQDCNQALVYFRAAAEEDNAPAMSHLGAMYSAGQCVKQDRRTAYSWFARAAQADPHNQWISRNLNMVYRDMTPEERASAR